MIKPGRVIFVLTVVILIIGYFTASSHLNTNIELITTLLNAEDNIKIKQFEANLMSKGILKFDTKCLASNIKWDASTR